MKKITALLLATVMIFSLCACGRENKVGELATADPLTKEDVVQIVIGSHASWPYREDWKVWEYIEEGCGATLDVIAYPSTDAGTKINLMFAAPDTLPDVLYGSHKPGSDARAIEGSLIALEDMEEYMPNYNAWLDSLSEEDYANKVAIRKAYDGKTYYTPVEGREASQDVRAWIYRKDIFEKHNLKVPETFDELYEVCKQLKKIYPESYPLCVREGLKVFFVTGSSWKPYWETSMYYDYNAEKWSYGTIEPTMLEVIEFYKKMMDEGLITPDFMTITNQSWAELVTTDKGFIMPEYQTRIDFFNSMARAKNPEFDMQAMIPPVAKEDGLPMLNKFNLDQMGLQLPNSKVEKRIANAAKFVDWFYTDEAMELVSWGKEGETYEIVDGKKQYITDATGTQANTLYGFGTYATFTRMDPNAVLAFESADIAETRDMVLEHTMPYANPTLWLAFNEEEQKVKEEYETALAMYANEMVAKFILGQEPLAKWDEFVANMKEMGTDKLIEAYTSAYDRVK